VLWLQVALALTLALYAANVLRRYVPVVVRDLRGERGPRTFVALFIVALAVVFLVVAMKDLIGGVISR
jgi:hypothetical protein